MASGSIKDSITNLNETAKILKNTIDKYEAILDKYKSAVMNAKSIMNNHLKELRTTTEGIDSVDSAILKPLIKKLEDSIEKADIKEIDRFISASSSVSSI